MNGSFQRTLDHIRSVADSEAQKGRLFERLMKTYFLNDPLYGERFSNVWLWSEWAAVRPDFDGADTGIDLVAEERRGGYCAIQCKCHAPGTQISKPHLDSFIARFGPRSVHRPHRRGYRRRLGAERPQDHRSR